MGKKSSYVVTYLLALATVFVTVSMVAYPKDAFDSAIQGLNLWWTVVFPALLPFFILSELLMGFGVVHFIGVILEPLMRPVFNVPGVGAFAMSMGLASGYPMDAVITCKFRQENLCSAVEAERLLSFTNTADPLFMFGAVAVGMFGMPELGAVIALAHYLSSFLVGIIFRFYGRGRDVVRRREPASGGNILFKAFKALYNARQEDGRSLGNLLGESVKASMQTILLIGGFIILFSVFIRILNVVGITGAMTDFFETTLLLIGFSPNLAPSVVSGLLEIDIGTLAASQADAPLAEKVAVAGAIIAWSGLSVHGQVASIVISSGIRMVPYIIARFLHAVIAGLLTLFFFKHAQVFSGLFVLPVMHNLAQPSSLTFWLMRFEQVCYQLLILLAIFVTLSFAVHLARNLSAYVKR
ncbi:MAG: sporulation integral membrane protein YlbJ [Sporomusaceae bacterium]|jgi:sporulation integral membrane protein YlbJ|nr:sporulation integral membrane protein YlbJ [Sporomusaceae bacterium]